MNRSSEPTKKDKPAEPKPVKRDSRKLRNLLLILGALGGVYFFLGRIVYPFALRLAAQRAIDAVFTAEVDRVGKIEITPEGDLAVRDVALVTRHAASAREFLRADRLTFVFDTTVWGLLFESAEPILRRIDIEHPRLNFVREGDGTWNVEGALMPRPKPSPPPSPSQPTASGAPTLPPRDPFPVDGIRVKNGMAFAVFPSDRSEACEWGVEALNFVVTKDRRGQLRVTDPEHGFDVIQGRAYEGAVKIDVQILKTQPLEGNLRVDVRDADVSKLTRDVDLGRKLRGRLNVLLTVSRSKETEYQVVGSGRMEVVRGDLFDYPPIVSVFEMLGAVGSGERKIEEVYLDLSVRQNAIEVKNINLLGTPVSLFGDGQCNLWGEDLYLVFVPKMGRGSGGAVVNLLVGELGVVVVEGAVLRPQSHVRALPTVLAPFRAVVRFVGGK